MALQVLQKALSADTRFRAGRWFLHQPQVAIYYIRYRPSFDGSRFDEVADLVVDGFPRSANTHAWYATKRAFGDAYEVRGHTHSPITLLSALNYGVPAVLVLRNPDDAVASYVQAAAGVSLRSAFHAYRAFHKPLLPARDRLVVAGFDRVVGAWGDVMREANQRYHRDVPVYEGTLEDEKFVRNQIDDADRRRWGGHLREEGVARPSAYRKKADEILVNLDVDTRRERDHAQDIYHQLLPR